MDRNRELYYEYIQKQSDDKILKGFLFTHIKADIKSKEIHNDDILVKNEKKDFQNRIADIRTDLDSFSKIEAYSLMYNGYKLFEKQIENQKIAHKKENWVFLSDKINYELNQDIQKELELGKYMFGRRFRKWWGSR